MALIQWVNLEKEEVFAKDPDVGSIDRCGKVTVEAVFKNGEVPLGYQVKVVDVGSDNVTYTEEEKNRNGNFKFTKGSMDIAVDKSFIMDKPIRLSAAGGNKYKIEARDENDILVSSLEIETKRKLYYQFMYMNDSKCTVFTYPLDSLVQHCAKHHVVLTKTRPSTESLPFYKTIVSDAGSSSAAYTDSDFCYDISKICELDEFQQRVGFVAALSNYLATMKKIDVVRIISIVGEVDAGEGCTVSSSEQIITIELDMGDHLWFGLDDKDDAVQQWFVSGAIILQDMKGVEQSTAQLSIGDVCISGSPNYESGGYYEIDIKINDQVRAMLENKLSFITFRLTINVVDCFSGGYRWMTDDGIRFITCATKGWWDDLKPDSSRQVWNHETGHRMGMVAYGNIDHLDNDDFVFNPGLPDAPSSLYGENRGVNDKEHFGPHCETTGNGIKLNYSTTQGWYGVPGCVMFGSTSTPDGEAPLDYCEECTPIVRKLDLSD